MWGERSLYYEDTVSFKDERNRLQCDVLFNAEGIGFLKGMFTKQKQPCDFIRGEIVRHTAEKGKKKDVVAQLEGSWLAHLDVDGKRCAVPSRRPRLTPAGRLWSMETTLPHVIIPADDPLPSDCRFRDDLVALAEKDLPTARESKLMLEERQRYDAKLRAGTPKPKPAKSGGKEKGVVYKDVPVANGATKDKGRVMGPDTKSPPSEQRVAAKEKKSHKK